MTGAVLTENALRGHTQSSKSSQSVAALGFVWCVTGAHVCSLWGIFYPLLVSEAACRKWRALADWMMDDGDVV